MVVSYLHKHVTHNTVHVLYVYGTLGCRVINVHALLQWQQTSCPHAQCTDMAFTVHVRQQCLLGAMP